jgi:hypothetical protein
VWVGVREWIEEIWAKCWPYVDPRLPMNAMNDFFPAFWELDLANSMVENGVPLVEKTISEGPDLVCRSTPSVHIEAIVATPGDPSHPDSVPSIFDDVDVPHDQLILRLRNAIEKKTEKRNEYLQKGILDETDPYVIAINSAPIDSSRAEATLPDILRAVLPFGDEYVTIELPSGDVVGGGFHYRPEILKTKRPPGDPTETQAAPDADFPSESVPGVPPEKSPVSTTVFQEAKYDGISAVLFSCCDEVNRPDVAGAELTLICNPRATKNPVPENFFPFGREYIVQADQSVKRVYRSPESRPRFLHLIPLTHSSE